jgi:hypothetical protein
MREIKTGFQDYLGDGVYASFDGYQIWLAANHPDNRVIALEPMVFEALLRYQKDLLREALGAEGGGV